MPSACYYYRSETLPDGSLDSSVDCTYVLLMVGSKREHQIREQVRKAGLTSTVIFQYNYGYKKCDKPLKHKLPNFDLYHANQTVFRHALSRGYRRILLLEDDCVFDNKITNNKVVDDLNTFLKKENPSIYNLGSSLLLSSPISILSFNKHQRMIISFDTHAVVYNDTYMKWLCNNQVFGGHVDFAHNFHWSKFTYIVPLAYQPKVETNNSINGFGSMYGLMSILIYKPFNLDDERSFSKAYNATKSLYDFISIFMFFGILYVLIGNLKNSIN